MGWDDLRWGDLGLGLLLAPAVSTE
jgi:hypothetical protein